jgi:hypothetical protein
MADRNLLYVVKHARKKTDEQIARNLGIRVEEVVAYRKSKNILRPDEIAKRRTRRAFLGAGIAAGVDVALETKGVGLVSLALSLFAPERPRHEVGNYFYDPESGLILKREFEEAMHRDDICLVVRDTMWRKMQHPKYRGRFDDVKDIAFKSLKTRGYIKPLKEYDPSIFQEALAHIIEDYTELGLKTDFKIIPTKSIDDLAAPKEGSSLIHITREVGLQIVADTFAVHSNGHKERIPFKGNKPEEGKAAGTGRLQDGDIVLKPGYIFIKADDQDAAGAHFGMYCEMMHHQLGTYTVEIMKHLTDIVKGDNEFHYKGFRRATLMAQATEEAVVHALAIDWMRKNRKRFGIPQKDADREIKENEGRFLYLGVPTILRIVENRGRAAVLHDYKQNPIKYFEIVRKSVKEFRESPIVDN